MARIGTLTLLLLLAGGWAPTAAQPASEADLMALLRSPAPAAEKESACLRLKRIGTAASVPALASLLESEDLSFAARDALESMPCPEAGEALRQALGRTTGRTRAGIIASLGLRREAAALSPLSRLLLDPDPGTAMAAAAALGHIGGTEGIQALRSALPAAAAPLRGALADALLRCADQLLKAGDSRGATDVYTHLSGPVESQQVRVAAHLGRIRASGDRAVSLAVEALRGTDAAARMAALETIREMGGGKKTTTAFAALLERVPPELQVALLSALGQRGDPAAQGVAARAAKGADAGVRRAALDALAELGDASQVPLLAEIAASSVGAERDAARGVLLRLHRGDVAKAILERLPRSRPEVQAELIQALARRGEKGAVPALLKLAAGARDETAVSALEALGTLAEDAEAGALMEIVARSRGQAAREAAMAALVAVSSRGGHPEAVAARVLEAASSSAAPAKCALLEAAGQMGGPGVLDALRAAARDAGPEVRDAAIRTLSEYGPTEALPDLLALAQNADSPARQVLALRGYWRLVGLAGGRPLEDRLRLCREGFAACRRPEEKRLGLAQAAAISHPDALALVEGMCADAAVRDEAELAAVQVATRLLGTQRAASEATLRRLASGAAGEPVRVEARAALDALARFHDYVVPWLVAGPYRQAGKECQQLYDIPFAPETAPDGVEWKALVPPADPLTFWQADLGGVVGGNHCVVYIKTRVYSPDERPVALEIGNDDGVKLWVNGELVHANNAVRGLTPGQDHASCRLKRGWNDFLAKVTQHTMGCALCVRIVAPDGSPVAGLRFDPAGE